MVMDGAEDVEEPESRGMFRTVLAEASSIVHSMFGKLILDFTKIHHNLPSTQTVRRMDGFRVTIR
jgi:hypothetical protein